MPAQAYQTDYLRAGAGSLNLQAIDAIPPTDWSRLTNVMRLISGQWTSRYGQTSLTNAIGTTHHTIARLNDPQGATWTRVWGIDTSLYIGQTGALTSVEGGFSGDPLTLTEGRPPFSGDTWMYVADRTKMRKVRTDGLDLAQGLIPPAAAPTVALQAELTVTIENFESGFTGYAGTGAAPTLSYPAGKDANALNILTAQGSSTTGYYNIADKALTVDLSQFAGPVPSTDDDLIHLWVKVDRPDYLSDIKIYLVVSTFTAGVIPGQSTTQNTDAYMKAFVGSDFTTTIELVQGPESAAEDATRLDQIDESLIRPEDRRQALEELLAQRSSTGLAALSQVVGRGQWTEYGVLGVPLRKSDFLRIGSGNVDWATVTGIVVIVQTAVAQPINVTLDQAFLRGGRGPDTTDVGQRAYDYRIIHYDPRTGVYSNPSPEMVEANYVNPLRRGVNITPAAAYGDAAIRQWAFRRGGGADTSANWFFVGANTSDGGVISDHTSDAEIVTEETLEIDNDRPITTVDENGTAVYGQAVAVQFGPVNGYLFALGDPYRPGFLYWSKRDAFDHWPPGNRYEACSPSEELLAGAVFGSQAFCWSRARLFAVLPDQDGPGLTVVVPTLCTRGLVSRWSFCVGPDALYAVDQRGLYSTVGGVAEDLTAGWVRPLFRGQAANGYLAIDFTVPLAIRLGVYQSEIWLLYQDTGGTRRVLIYDTVEKGWRAATFARALACVSGERTPGAAEVLLLGGFGTSRSYSYSGFSDDGVAIAASLRTGSQDAGHPRQDKTLGDLVVLADRQGETITVTPYLNYEASSLAPVTITSGAGLQQTVLNPFSEIPTEAKTLALDLTWSSAVGRPILAALGWSYIVRPDDTNTRPSDWEDLGTSAAKFLKGIALLVDTLSVSKTIVVEAILDNGNLQTLGPYTVQAPRKGLVTLTWPAIRATQFRYRPTDSGIWQVYDATWIADLETVGRTRWEGIETNHGIVGWQTVYWADVCLRSSASTVLTVVVQDADGDPRTFTYELPTTNGAKVMRHVPFQAAKGVLFKYTLESAAACWVYAQESGVWVAPWGGDARLVPALGLPDVQEDAA